MYVYESRYVVTYLYTNILEMLLSVHITLSITVDACMT